MLPLRFVHWNPSGFKDWSESFCCVLGARIFTLTVPLSTQNKVQGKHDTKGSLKTQLYPKTKGVGMGGRWERGEGEGVNEMYVM